MKRLVAILVAVALVAGAYLIRRAIDGDVGSTDRGADGQVSSDRRIICATELALFCQAEARNGSLQGWSVAIERPGVTADRLSQEADAKATWLAPTVWVDLVNDRRARASRPALTPTSKILARSGLSLVLARTSRAITATAACQDPPEWRCIGDATEADLRLGLSIRTSTAGLLSEIAATSSYFGTTSFATNDIDLDPDYDAWIRRIGADRTVDPVTVLVTAPGTYDAAVDLDVDVDATFAERGDDNGFTIQPVQPQVTADLVLLGGSGIDTATLAKALVRAGWSTPTESKLPKSSQLPNPGVVDALLSS